MDPLLFVLGLGGIIFSVLTWGFFTLPKEKWQIMAALPTDKCGQGEWKGLNLTWYGVFSANAYLFGVSMAILLAASAGVPVMALVMLTLVLLMITIPASKGVARIVEKKKATLTVGGAVFVGVVCAPWIILGLNLFFGQVFDFSMPVFLVMACLSIGYTFGEALGRLACLSFGCCYGKALCQCSDLTQNLFAKFYVIYSGETKKAAYASGMEGEKMIPIQIITAVIYTVSGLVGTWLFLKGMVGAALIETLIVTQVWRVISEFFRADFRGVRKFSTYQIMALAAIAYVGVLLFIIPETGVDIHLEQGFSALWQPGILIFFQGIWITSFLHSGRSSVTGSKISFHLIQDNI